MAWKRLRAAGYTCLLLSLLSADPQAGLMQGFDLLSELRLLEELAWPRLIGARSNCLKFDVRRFQVASAT